LPLFIGFSGNGKYTTDNTNICIPQTLDHIRRSLADEYIKSKNIEDPGNISDIPEVNHINYLNAYCTISEIPLKIIGALNIESFSNEGLLFLPDPKVVSQEEIDRQQSNYTCQQLFNLIN